MELRYEPMPPASILFGYRKKGMCILWIGVYINNDSCSVFYFSVGYKAIPYM